MRIILAHPGLDFDALASMVAAKKLYPDAVMVTLGKPYNNVQEFIALHKDTIEIKNYIDKEQITGMILVDTRNGKRLQDYAVLLQRDNFPIIIYDHHKVSNGEIPGAELHFAETGANVTQLIELIQERGIEITPQEATVLALGIYEDTGSLSYLSTTHRDLRAAAFLLEKGANLAVVANFIDRPISKEQQDLLNTLMRQAEIVSVQGLDILFAEASLPGYVGELSLLTGKLRDLHTVAAVFSIVRMGKRVYVVARSNTAQINVQQVLLAYQGAGHNQAASAMIKEESISLGEIREELTHAVAALIEPPLLVRDIMTTPVKTIPALMTINEVAELMMRYGHSGYPVMDQDKIVGIVSRQDVEKSRYHGFGHVPVKGYMSHHVVTVAADMTVEEARGLMLQKNIGRLPVTEEGRLVGIISRSDLLNLMYGKYKRYRTLYQRQESNGQENLLPKMKAALSEQTFQILGEIASLADREGYAVFLVGGFVRDLLMNVPSIDLDLVVEGDGIAFGRILAEYFGGRLLTYDRFGTANLELSAFLKIDIASTRTEFYEFPAAMPQVETSSLRQDLYRRDFTINAMAVSLNFRSIGRLVDFFNGRRDLDEGKLRVLHNLSFVEDPTRILRALRFSVRYHFVLEEETEAFAKKAVEDGVFQNLSYLRLWHELILALQEDDPFAILSLYHRYGIWPYVFPYQDFDESLRDAFSRIEEDTAFLAGEAKPLDRTLISFLLLTAGLEKEELTALFNQADCKRAYKDAAYALEEISGGFYDTVMERSDLDWYYFFAETKAEVIAVLALKGDQAVLTRLQAAYAAFCRIRIYSGREDFAKLEGYARPLYRQIMADMIEEKYQGRLHSGEEEIAYVRENIEKGVYRIV